MVSRGSDERVPTAPDCSVTAVLSSEDGIGAVDDVDDADERGGARR